MKREEVLELKERADYHWQRSRELQNVVEEEKQLYIKAITEYRVTSTKRVLEHILKLARSKDGINRQDLDIYIVHCVNKLNGNIDGLELALGEK